MQVIPMQAKWLERKQILLKKTLTKNVNRWCQAHLLHWYWKVTRGGPKTKYIADLYHESFSDMATTYIPS